MADDRIDRSHQRPGDNRPPFRGPRPPFRPPGGRIEPAAPMLHSVRLRDGERELEVTGSAVFVRQLLDDLASLWPRLHGNGPVRPANIAMPSPPPPREKAPAATLDDRVIAVLREAGRPLAVAAIRKRLGDGTTPQQVRRVLERNANHVAAAGTRPATYRLR